MKNILFNFIIEFNADFEIFYEHIKYMLFQQQKKIM